jgi:hypothetical protein
MLTLVFSKGHNVAGLVAHYSILFSVRFKSFKSNSTAASNALVIEITDDGKKLNRLAYAPNKTREETRLIQFLADAVPTDNEFPVQFG